MKLSGNWASILALSFLSACGSPGANKEMDSKASTAEFYAEESVNGRVYVFGTEKAHQGFKASKQTPAICATFIGAGSSGETVVLEADAKSPQLQTRLKAEFNRRHGPRL